MPTSCCAISCMNRYRKGGKINSNPFLPILTEEAFGSVPCIVKTGVLRSILGHAANIL